MRRPGRDHFGCSSTRIEDVRSRRRLVGYLVRADIKKKGADTFLGNLWWVLDPLLQMVVYVVFVSIIFQRPTPDYPLFVLAAILPWKWFSSSMNDATMSVIGQGSLIRQIQFPKIVLPIALDRRGGRRLRVRAHPAGRRSCCSIPHRISAFVLLIPVVAVVQFLFTLGVVAPRRLGQRVLPRPRQRPAPLPAPVVLPVARACTASRWSQDERRLRRTTRRCCASSQLNPFAILFESYRAVIYGDPISGPHMPDWVGARLAGRRQRRC